jgi:hypothetical protein
MLEGAREGGLYPIQFPNPPVVTPELCALANVVPNNPVELWHNRLGHINPRFMKEIFACVAGIPSILKTNWSKYHEMACVGCLEGKFRGLPVSRHPNSTSHAIVSTSSGGEIGKLFAMDLMFSSHPSLAREVCVLTIIEASSGYLWCVPLKSKEGHVVLEAIKTWIAQLAIVGIKPRNWTSIRTDNGTEFVNKDLSALLLSLGITHERSPPMHHVYIIERANQTLQRTARALLIHANLHVPFWANALSTACHILNCTPTKRDLSRSRSEALTGVKPDISYFRTWGCSCWAKTSEQSTIWEPHASRCIFLGYGHDVGAARSYRLWNVATKTIIMSDQVVFNETSILTGPLNRDFTACYEADDMTNLLSFDDICVEGVNEDVSDVELSIGKPAERAATLSTSNTLHASDVSPLIVKSKKKPKAKKHRDIGPPNPISSRLRGAIPLVATSFEQNLRLIEPDRGNSLNLQRSYNEVPTERTAVATSMRPIMDNHYANFVISNPEYLSVAHTMKAQQSYALTVKVKEFAHTVSEPSSLKRNGLGPLTLR